MSATGAPKAGAGGADGVGAPTGVVVDVDPKEKAGLSEAVLEAGGGVGAVVEVDPKLKAGAAGGGAEIFASALGAVLEVCGVEAVELLLVPDDAAKESFPGVGVLLSIDGGTAALGAAAVSVAGFPN